MVERVERLGAELQPHSFANHPRANCLNSDIEVSLAPGWRTLVIVLEALPKVLGSGCESSAPEFAK